MNTSFVIEKKIKQTKLLYFWQWQNHTLEYYIGIKDGGFQDYVMTRGHARYKKTLGTVETDQTKTTTKLGLFSCCSKEECTAARS